jgi:hypothetical protein
MFCYCKSFYWVVVIRINPEPVRIELVSTLVVEGERLIYTLILGACIAKTRQSARVHDGRIRISTKLERDVI